MDRFQPIEELYGLITLLLALRRKFGFFNRKVESYAWTKIFLAEIVGDFVQYAFAMTETQKNAQMRKLVEKLGKYNALDLLLDPKMSVVLRRLPGVSYTGSPFKVGNSTHWVTYISGTNCIFAMKKSIDLLDKTMSDLKRSKRNPFIWMRLLLQSNTSSFTMTRLFAYLTPEDSAVDLLEEKRLEGDISAATMEELITFPMSLNGLQPSVREIIAAMEADRKRQWASK